MRAARAVFVTCLVSWCVLPVLAWGRLAQDAVPYAVAGEMVPHHIDDVYTSEYGGMYNLRPAFSSRYCARDPDRRPDCERLSVGFVATPLALPAAIAVAHLDGDLTALLFRLTSALALVGGMAILWRRLTSGGPEAATPLAVTAVALTPFVVVPVGLGQTSPLLFLSACLGVEATNRNRAAVARAGLWVLSIALKLFPTALVLVLLVQRRWRMLAWAAAAAAALGALAVATLPAAAWEGFARSSEALSSTAANDLQNISIVATVDHLVGTLPLAARVACGAAGAIVVVALFVTVLRRARDDVQWAVASGLLLLAVPVVWWHYTWLALAALAMALTQRRPSGRDLLALPVAAGVITILTALPEGTATSVARTATLVAILAAAVVVVRRGTATAPAARITAPSAG